MCTCDDIYIYICMSGRAVMNMVVLRGKVCLFYRHITCSHLSAFTPPTIEFGNVDSDVRVREHLNDLHFFPSLGVTLKNDEGNYGGKCPATV